jgi:hypothetical protein
MPAVRLHRGSGALGAERRERLRVAAFHKGGYRQQLRSGHHPLAAASGVPQCPGRVDVVERHPLYRHIGMLVGPAGQCLGQCPVGH